MARAEWRRALTRERGGRGTAGPWDPPAWLAWGSLAAAAAATLVIVWHSTGPFFVNDEVSSIGASRLIAHPGEGWELGGWSYLPGTAVLLAPLWWLTDDPLTFYRAGIFVLGAVSVALAWPLTRIAQELGLSRNAGLVLASIIVAAPEHALLANYLWSEQLLSLVVALTVWRGMVVAREWRRGSLRTASAVWLGFAAAGCYAAHGRSVAFAGVAGAALLVIARRNRPAGVPALAAYVWVIAAAQLLFHWVSSSLYPYNLRTARTVDSLANQDLSQIVASGASQIWYVTAAWSGVAALGAVGVARWAWRGDHALPARWLATGVGASALFFTVSLAGADVDGRRLDLDVYGRYLTPFALPLALMGLVMIAKGVSRRVQAAAVCLVIGAALGVAVLVVPGLPPGGSWRTAHIPGIAFVLNPSPEHRDDLDPWGLILVLLGCLAVLVILLARMRRAALSVVALTLLGISIWTDQGVLVGIERERRGPAVPVEAMRDVPPDVALAGDSRVYPTGANRGLYAVWAHPRRFVLYHPDAEERPSDAVVGAVDWGEAREAGALPLDGSYFEGTVVWVFPGALQDGLLAEGRLLRPPGLTPPG